jgi:hypothetical protein
MAVIMEIPPVAPGTKLRLDSAKSGLARGAVSYCISIANQLLLPDICLADSDKQNRRRNRPSLNAIINSRSSPPTRGLRTRCNLFAACLFATALPACKMVTVPTADATPPIVKMDLYFGDEVGELANNFGGWRRSVRMTEELTLVASAEDAESGISTLEIVAMVINECDVTRSFPGPGPGAPHGPPVGQTTLQQNERVLASASAAAAGNTTSLPQTRLANAKMRLEDLKPEPCGPVKFWVNDDPPTAVTIAERSTTFCGVRVFARAQNGTGQTQSTDTGFFVEGPRGSGAFPCVSVPF